MKDKTQSSKRATGTKAKSGKAGAATAVKKGAAASAKKGASASAKKGGVKKSTAAGVKKAAGGLKGRASLPPPGKPSANDLRREASKKTALAIALAALDKKAERVEIVDIGEKVDYADYLVVMTGRSDRQVVAIAQGIEESLKKQGVRTSGMEGMPQGQWVLVDYSDVIVHIFLDEARKYYDLEGLWMDAPRVPTPSFNPPAPNTFEPPQE